MLWSEQMCKMELGTGPDAVQFHLLGPNLEF